MISLVEWFLVQGKILDHNIRQRKEDMIIHLYKISLPNFKINIIQRYEVYHPYYKSDDSQAIDAQ